MSHNARKIGKLFALLFASLITVTHSYAALLQPGGKTFTQITEFTGDLTGVYLYRGAQEIFTGPLELALDASYGADNFFVADWDTKTASTRFHLLISAPEIGVYGVPIEINESGALTSPLPLFDTTLLYTVGNFPEISGSLIGGGTVQEGDFAGFTYRNINNFSSIRVEGDGNKVYVSPEGDKVKVELPASSPMPARYNLEGTITPPPTPQNLNPLPQRTTGNGNVLVQGIPEPSTWVLALAGLVVGAGFRRRLKYRAS